jgi:AbiJ-like protein
MRFSQRHGYMPAQKAVQLESIDNDLRSALWDAIHFYLWEHAGIAGHYATSGASIYKTIQTLWHGFFKLPVDTIPARFEEAVGFARKYFFARNWFEVYDFVEFISTYVEERNKFRNFCNRVLERENSAYRFVGDIIAPISSKTELESIDDAIAAASTFPGVSTHLKSALGHLSDRKNPDFRNSVKESISAIESLCRTLTGIPKATLGETLAVLEKHGVLHGALRASFSALYGYTSDEGGIRHAMLEEPKLTFTDAKYMLVACSGFVNYMIGKVADVGYKIPPTPKP